MSFKNYYESVQKTFKFRIKSIYELDGETMDVIEAVLSKYRPTDMTRPKRMMFQTFPLGYTGPKVGEAFFVDVTLTVPVAPSVLAYEIKDSFGLNTNSDILTVTNPDEAEEEVEHKEALLSDPEYKEVDVVKADDHFGDKYNGKFLKYLAKSQEEREEPLKVDAQHPITKWAKQPDPTADLNTTDFNKDRDKAKSPISGRSLAAQAKKKK